MSRAMTLGGSRPLALIPHRARRSSRCRDSVIRTADQQSPKAGPTLTHFLGYWRKGAVVLPDPLDRPVITAEEAFAELGIDRSTGYRSIREGTFPVPVLRIGRLIRVPVAPLRRLLERGELPKAEGEG